MTSGRDADHVDQQLIVLYEAQDRQADLLQVDIGSKQGSEQVDTKGDQLTFSHTNVAEYESAGKVFFPLRSVEGHQHHDNEQEDNRMRAEADGAGNGEANEDGGESVATVIEQFSKRGTSACAASLLTVKRIQGLVEPETEEVQRAKPLRGSLGQIGAVPSRQKETRQTRNEAREGDQVGTAQEVKEHANTARYACPTEKWWSVQRVTEARKRRQSRKTCKKIKFHNRAQEKPQTKSRPGPCQSLVETRQGEGLKKEA